MTQRALYSNSSPKVVEGFSRNGAAFAAEFVIIALAYVILNVATSEMTDGNGFYGAAIALVVLQGLFRLGLRGLVQPSSDCRRSLQTYLVSKTRGYTSSLNWLEVV